MLRFLLKCSILLTAILASCSMQELLWPENTRQRTVNAYNNPHSDCLVCHMPGNTKESPVQSALKADPSSLCEGCHQYAQNHHPVNFIPEKPVGGQFPLYEGRVGCLTCHEIHGGPEHKGAQRLLRGGPYADRRTICFQCHEFEDFAKINPHDMLDSSGNVRQEKGRPVCLLCHSINPDPAVDMTENVRFRADIGFLCWRCHPPMPGIFFSQHFLVKPSAETLRNISETEERRLVILPLVPRGRITCSTCHNPHQTGVIQREAAAKGSDTRSKLRLPSLCFGCHRM